MTHDLTTRVTETVLAGQRVRFTYTIKGHDWISLPYQKKLTEKEAQQWAEQSVREHSPKPVSRFSMRLPTRSLTLALEDARNHLGEDGLMAEAITVSPLEEVMMTMDVKAFTPKEALLPHGLDRATDALLDTHGQPLALRTLDLPIGPARITRFGNTLDNGESYQMATIFILPDAMPHVALLFSQRWTSLVPDLLATLGAESMASTFGLAPF